MRVASTALLMSFISFGVASGWEIAPPPPLVDYAEPSYVGLSYVAVCGSVRQYSVVVSAPFGDGVQLRELRIGDRIVGSDEMTALNEKLTAFKSFTTLTTKCLAGGDLMWIEGWPRSPNGNRTSRVVIRLSGERVTVD